MPLPPRASASTAPDCELRRKSTFEAPASSRADTTRGSLNRPCGPGTTPPEGSTETLVPAVRYSPASTTQSSPSGMPSPEFAPSRQRSPSATRWRPPPESIPMVEAPPPTSEPSPMMTPWDTRPSTMERPSVPAL